MSDLVLPTIRIFLALCLALYLPGYALSLCIFAGKVADKLVRMLLSFGGSIIISSLLAYLLSTLEMRLTAGKFVVCLIALCLCLSVVAVVRTRNVQTSVKPSCNQVTVQGVARDFGVPLLSMALVAGLIQTTHLIQTNPSLPMTEFYVPPTYAETARTASGDVQIPLRVVNRENQDVEYRIEAWTGTTKVAEQHTFRVKPEETWQDSLAVRAGQSSSPVSIELLLFRVDGNAPIAQLRIWVGSSP